MGDHYLRRLLVVGATAGVRYTRRKATAVRAWASQLLERRAGTAGHGRCRQQGSADRLGGDGA